MKIFDIEEANEKPYFKEGGIVIGLEKKGKMKKDYIP